MAVRGRAAGSGNNLHGAVESDPFPGFPPRWGVLLEEMLQPKQGPAWECRGCEMRLSGQLIAEGCSPSLIHNLGDCQLSTSRAILLGANKPICIFQLMVQAALFCYFIFRCLCDVTVPRSSWCFLRGRKKWMGLLWDVSASSLLPF